MPFLINKTLRIELPIEGSVTIGRSTDCELQLNFPTISKKHMRVFEENGTWFAEDLESANSSYVNGEKIKRAELQSGDYLRVDAYTVVFFAGTPPALPELTVQDPGSVIRQRLPISKPVLKLGRSLQSNHVPVDDPAVSSRHMDLCRIENRWQVRLAKHSSKIRVNEHKIDDPTFVNPGDQIRIGSTILEISIQQPPESFVVSSVHSRLTELFRSLRMQARTIEDAVTEQYPAAAGYQEWISAFLEVMTLIERSCNQLETSVEEVRTLVPSMETVGADSELLNRAVNLSRQCNNLANYIELILRNNQLTKIKDAELDQQRTLMEKLYKNIHGCLETDNPTLKLG